VGPVPRRTKRISGGNSLTDPTSTEEQFTVEASASLLAQPYDDRQLLVIADEVRPPEPAGGSGAAKAVLFGAAMLPVALMPIVGSAGLVAKLLVDWIEERTRRAATEGVDIRSVTRADVQGLLFPPGHPRRKVVYVGHPFLKQQYMPFASFHRALFEQKVIEAMELLAGLGATSIKIRQVAGTEASASIAASLGVPVQGAKVDVGSEIGKRRSESGEILASATLAPTQAPRVPNDLIWYPHERFWQGVTRMRLENGLEAYSLEVNYDEDYGINAKVSAKLEKIGFDIGGSYSNIESTKWVMQGEFAPLNTLPPRDPDHQGQGPDGF
jgi:hypothetical protein